MLNQKTVFTVMFQSEVKAYDTNLIPKIAPTTFQNKGFLEGVMSLKNDHHSKSFNWN